MRFMQRLINIARTIWCICILLAGLVIGAMVGHASGGWIGAICLGATGLLLASFFALPGGLTFALQIFRLFQVV
jgi:hypothetical protein